MAAVPTTEAQNVAMMRARPAERIWLEFLQGDDQASFDNIASETGLKPIGPAWTSIKRPEAINLLERLLHRDLAYNAPIMPTQRARRLAEWFVKSFERDGCRYATNRPLVNGHLSSSWTPATSNTFDAGVVIVSRDRVGVYWVADED